ncbi:MAG: ABC transporter ATP-binding protein [Thermoplasmata archaeon]|nr:ABC transporter ATP-binding protein [Thermoplasmata archaeon]
MSPSDRLEVHELSAAWDGVPVVRSVSFSVTAGELLVLMGPNGGGKSTLLRTIAGLERPTGGSVIVDGRPLLDVPAHRRGIGMLFQEPALFPHRTVWENVAYGLEVARRPPAEVERRVAELAELLHLASLLERSPEGLSGGEQQRVALARTLAPRPAVVLLDEPFASVDPELRGQLASEFRSVLRAQGATAIFVTHDREEGLFLGDRVALLFDGRLLQVGTPDSVFEHPSTPAVARFLGYNVLETPAGVFGVLPGDVLLGREGSEELVGEVVGSARAGETTVTHLRSAQVGRVEARAPSSEPPRTIGSRLSIGWRRALEIPGRDVERPTGG